jgi:hypothetical protein
LLALGAAIAAPPSYAQEQNTSGPCSPAIAGVQGEVQVTCGTKDRGDSVDRAIRELIGDKPFTLNVPWPEYKRNDLKKSLVDRGSTFWYETGDPKIGTFEVLFTVDVDNIVKEILIYNPIEPSPLLKSKYILFNNRIERGNPKFYQEQEEDVCYTQGTLFAALGSIPCGDLEKSARSAGCRYNIRIETDGINKTGDVRFTYFSRILTRIKLYGNQFPSVTDLNCFRSQYFDETITLTSSKCAPRPDGVCSGSLPSLK